MIKYDIALLILVIVLNILYALQEEKITHPVGMKCPVILDILNESPKEYNF